MRSAMAHSPGPGPGLTSSVSSSTASVNMYEASDVTKRLCIYSSSDGTSAVSSISNTMHVVAMKAALYSACRSCHGGPSRAVRVTGSMQNLSNTDAGICRPRSFRPMLGCCSAGGLMSRLASPYKTAQKYG